VVPDPGALARVRAEFDQHQCVLLPKLLAPELVRVVLSSFEHTAFVGSEHEGIGVELCAQRGLATAVLELVANDPHFFEVVSALTGCGSIGSFVGRIMIAMSINLSSQPYSGGLLQMRRTNSDEVFYEVANLGLGDALMFRIDPSLLHQVTEVVGSVPKTAYAGWFRSRPSYRELLRKRHDLQRGDHLADDDVHHA
jgi:hypothetical protein